MESADRKLRLFCVPFAGGNRYSFQALKPYLDPEISFVGLEVPGRGSRMGEPLLHDLRAMARDLYRHVRPFADSPYVVFGHSMGGLLGCLLVRELHRHGHSLPRRLVVSGCIAPQFNVERPVRHTLPDAEFERELVRLGGMPAEVLEHRELLQLFLPVIRADFQAVETYRYEPAPLHDVPITAMKGSQESISERQLLGWQAETQGALETYSLPGNHFFILDHLPRLAALINQELSGVRMSVPYL